MRLIPFRWLLAAALTPMLFSGTAVAEPSVGAAAPAFTLPGADGKTYSLADAKGKVVVLEWLNHGCPFVRKHYDSGNMQKLQSAYTGKGVVWYSVISSAEGKEGYSTRKEALADAKKNKARATAVLLDPSGKVGRLYGAKTTPHMFIIDQKGLLVYAGAIDDIRSTDVEDVPKAHNFVSPALEEVLAGKPVAQPETKPYGCSVKYDN